MNRLLFGLGFVLALQAQTIDQYYAFALTSTGYDPGNYGAAYVAQLANVDSLASDGVGNFYFADSGFIRRIGADGTIVPVAFGSDPVTSDRKGNVYFVSGYIGAQGSSNNLSQLARISPDGQIQNWAAVPSGLGIAVADSGDVYVTDGWRVWRVAPTGAVTLFAGTGVLGYSGDGGPATQAMIYLAQRIAVDADGTVYLADTGNDRVRAIDANGIIRTVAQISRPGFLLPDGSGNLYVAGSSNTPLLSIYKVNIQQQSVAIFAGQPSYGPYGGDGGPATQAKLAGPRGMARDALGNLFFIDGTGVRIRVVMTDGTIHSVAGCGCGEDGDPVSWLSRTRAFGVARDAAGNLYFSDQTTHQVRRISPNGTQTIVAGNGESGFGGDGGPASAARLSWPAGVAVDAAGSVYIADQENNRIRKVTPDGNIQTIAGNGNQAYGGDGGPAIAASFAEPQGLAVDGAGNVYVADTDNNRVRRIATDGSIATVAGSATWGSGGDGGPAVAAQLINPRGLAFDTDGGLLISDSSAHRVRKLMPDATIRTVAAIGGTPYDAVPDGNGNIFIADPGLYEVLRLDAQGNLHRLPVSSGAATGIVAAAGGVLYVANGGVTALSPVNTSPLPLAPAIFASNIWSAGGLFEDFPEVVAPGEVLSVNGTVIGPASGVTASPSGGAFGTSLAGVRVWFDGFPAPILYADAGQATVIVPFEIAGQDRVGIHTEWGGAVSNTVVLPVVPQLPAFFFYTEWSGSIEAINQDGSSTLNNWAPVGSVVALYGTGGGVLNPPGATGQIAGAALARIAGPITATVDGIPTEVLYAGSAPGLVAGVFQINIRIPEGASLGRVVVTVGQLQATGSLPVAQPPSGTD